MKKLFCMLFAAAFIVAGAQAQIVNLWDDQAPSGGGMELVSTTELSALGIDTGHGDIGEFDAPVAAGNYKNYNTGTQDWSAYAGKSFTFTVDIYVTAAQMGDTNITDDTVYWSVAGANGGHTDISTLTADTWNTITMKGTFNSDTNVMATANFLLLNNDKGTDAVGVNYHIDNFKLDVDISTRFSVDNLNLRPNADNTKRVYGTPGAGEIIVHPDVTNSWLSSDGPINPPELKLRWQGIDINGNGSTNDYFDFTLNIAPNTGPTYLRGVGLGDNWKLNGTDGLTLTVKDIAVSASAGGTVEFEGFTSAGLYGVDYGDSMYDFTADLNGISLSCVDTNPAAPSGATYHLANDAFAATNVLVCNNPVYGADGGAGYLRDFDLSFTWITNEAPVYVDVTNTIDFVSSEGFVNGGISGQVDWVESNSGADFVVDTTTPGTATATNNQVNATLVNPINGLKAGDTVTYTVDFQFQGTPADLSNVTNNNFTGYYMNVGMTTTNAGDFIGANQPYAEAARFQRYYLTNSASHFVRLLQNNFMPAGGNMADIALNDELRITYAFSVGVNAGSSTVTTTLSNKTQAVSSGGTYGIQSSAIYDALVSTNGGAYCYFEANTLNHVTGIKVDRVEIVYPQLFVDYGSPYGQWAHDQGVTGTATDDDDSDGLNNYGEYVFGGNPLNGTDQGTQPSMNGTIYNYSLVGDSNIVAYVLTNLNLVVGQWGTNQTLNVSATDGVLSNYTLDVSGNPELFIKLEVQ